MPSEYDSIGRLMVHVYLQLDGFPKPNEQPGYYHMLAHVGDLTTKPETELLIAINTEGNTGGAVVYFGDMKYYGSGGTATKEVDSAGFRLLAVDPSARGMGLGKLLTNACIEKARTGKRKQVVIHTTKAMQVAWKMYMEIGFERSEDLDFVQGDLEVFGFRLTFG